MTKSSARSEILSATGWCLQKPVACRSTQVLHSKHIFKLTIKARLWTWCCFAENRVNSFHCCFTDLSAMSEKWLLFPQTYQQLVYLLCSQLFFCYIVLSCTMINLIVLLNIIFFCSVNTPNTQVSHLPLRINRNWSIFVEILNTRSLFSFLMKMFIKGFHEQHHALDFQAACVSMASTSLILLIG